MNVCRTVVDKDKEGKGDIGTSHGERCQEAPGLVLMPSAYFCKALDTDTWPRC